MRTTAKLVLIGGIITASLAAAPVQAQGVSAGPLTHTVTAVVRSFVRLVAEPSSEVGGAPVMRVVTNDPAIRAAYGRAIQPETLASAQVQYRVTGPAVGGAAALPGEAIASQAVERFTLVTP